MNIIKTIIFSIAFFGSAIFFGQHFGINDEPFVIKTIMGGLVSLLILLIIGGAYLFFSEN